MAKFVAIVLNIEYDFPHLSFVLDKNRIQKLFTSESQAEAYINKEYTENSILYGLIPDPTSAHKKLRKIQSGS